MILRLRPVAAFLLLPFVAACDNFNFAIPGLVNPGSNRPPLITTSTIKIDPNGLIQLSALVLEPDGNGLAVSYDQLSGPIAVQKSNLLIGGVLNVALQPTDPGLYVFRIIASDGFFNVTSNVSVTVGGGAASVIRRNPLGRTLPTGRFKIRLAGQTVSDNGFEPFTQDGELDLAEPAPTSRGENALAVTLTTNAVPFSTAAPAGAVQLFSNAPIGSVLGDVLSANGNGRNVVVTFGEQSGPTDDVLRVEFSGQDILLTGPIESAVDASVLRFRSAERQTGPLSVVACFVRFRISGDSVTGTVYVSSRPTAEVLLSREADYQAQMTGSRIR